MLLTPLLSLMTTLSAKTSPADRRFDTWKEAFVLRMWEVYPAWASAVGYHKYDSVLVIPDAASRKRELEFCRANLDSLKKFRLAALSPANKTDHRLIENQLQSAIWGIEELRAYEWDPSGYNVSGGFAEMLANDHAPLDERLRNFSKRLKYVPAYYEAAKQNIKNPTKEHMDLAITQNKGGLSVFAEDLVEPLKKSALSEWEKEQIRLGCEAATKAMNDYVRWLMTLKNETPRSFRLGKALYDKKFGYELQSGYTPEVMYRKAMAHKQELHNKMYVITRDLWPRYMAGKTMPADTLVAIRQMIDKLSEEHVAPEEFQAAIEKQLPILVDFIKRKDLLYIDPSKPLVVRREPAYMAGVAGASINSPGPYDKEGNTYYNVGSLDGWDKAKAESYLREYNKYILQILNIHEAIPGHYTQLVYANRSPSIIKAILGNNAMIEGWAVYTELMMLENGYNGDDTTATTAAPEMWLMYYKWNLRSTCNTILDLGVHTMNMSQEEAIHLLMDEAFQQDAEAYGKWRRVQVTQVQLCCYFTGFTEICDLRAELKRKKGTAFGLKKFHESFLGYGSAPVKYIRELMLR
ncbi:DUF885 domain-containing protein [Nemorincola caseinilytica]|uniref:DUF885 domain-containing protein n=1 Tax=Nemorincola caseinilytica TaxID=2054315 RepID=A0ABP8NPU1_9BACT